MKSTVIVIAAVLLPALAGCPGADSEPPSLAESMLARGETILPGDETADSDKYALLIQLRLASVEVPVGTASGSEEIWSYLNEEGRDPVHTAGLGRNGIRVGVGRERAWDDLARILGRMTGRAVHLRDMMSLPGNPAQIVLKDDQPVQTVFIFRDDGSVVGRDYPPGDNLLSVTCTVDRDDPSTVLLTALPQIRSSRQRPTIRRGAAGVRMTVRPDLFPLNELTFRATVPRGDFLIIGPGAASRRSVTAGHHFLVKPREGVQFETVLVLIPQAVLARAAATPKSAEEPGDE